MDFKLCNKERKLDALAVLILMWGDPSVAERPIKGYNVIEEVVSAQSPGSREDPSRDPSRLSSQCYLLYQTQDGDETHPDPRPM